MCWRCLEFTHRFSSQPAIMHFLCCVQGEGDVVQRVVYGVSHNAVGLWVETLCRDRSASARFKNVTSDQPWNDDDDFSNEGRKQLCCLFWRNFIYCFSSSFRRRTISVRRCSNLPLTATIRRRKDGDGEKPQPCIPDTGRKKEEVGV